MRPFLFVAFACSLVRSINCLRLRLACLWLVGSVTCAQAALSFVSMQSAVPIRSLLAHLPPDLSDQRRLPPLALEPVHDALVARQLPDGAVPARLQHRRERAVGQPLAVGGGHRGDQRLEGERRGRGEGREGTEGRTKTGKIEQNTVLNFGDSLLPSFL